MRWKFKQTKRSITLLLGKIFKSSPLHTHSFGADFFKFFFFFFAHATARDKTKSLVWVYARKVQPSCASAAQGHCLPTTSQYDVANTSSTASHLLYIHSDKANGTWNIGVTGSAAESSRVDAQYVIAAFVGCERYKDCNGCTEDPNCGWCARDRNNGLCVAGDPQGTDKTGGTAFERHSLLSIYSFSHSFCFKKKKKKKKKNIEQVLV